MSDHTIRQANRAIWVTAGGLLLAGMLLGCGGPMVFAKTGATEADLQRDGYECDQQWERSAEAIAFRLDPLGNAYYGTQARERKIRCLQAKGWTRVK